MRNRLILLLLALVCTGMSLYYVQKYVEKNVQVKEIVVFKTDIDSLSKVTSDMVETKRVSVNGLHPQTANKLTDVIGLFTVSKMVKGEPVLRNKLIESPLILNGHDYQIEPHERVIAVSTDLTRSGGGTVAIGDQVDLIAVLDEGGDPMVKTIAQQVRVVDVRDQNARKIVVSNKTNQVQDDSTVGSATKKNVPGAVLVAVRPQEAEQIVLYQKIGEIYLSQSPTEGTKYVSSGTKLSQLKQGNVLN